MRDYRPPAKRSRRRSPQKRQKKESRHGFGAGLTIGLIIAALVAIYDRVDWRQWLVAGSPPVAQRGTAEGSAAKGTQAPRFDFYTMLSEMEVAVPQEHLNPSPTKSSATPPKPSQDETQTYVLQVGSFRKYEDADRLKATLALLGDEARIHQVSIDGNAWYRVRLGPYKGLSSLSETRNRLAREEIPTIALQLK